MSYNHKSSVSVNSESNQIEKDFAGTSYVEKNRTMGEMGYSSNNVGRNSQNLDLGDVNSFTVDELGIIGINRDEDDSTEKFRPPLSAMGTSHRPLTSSTDAIQVPESAVRINGRSDSLNYSPESQVRTVPGE